MSATRPPTAVPRSRGLALRAVFIVCLGAASLVGCRGEKPVDASHFVGKWRSSRSTVPIHLYANGEWEIKRDDGPPLQYGVWRYDNGRIVWTFKADDLVGHEANTVVSHGPGEFSLRETDQTTSVFKRLD